MKSIIYRVAAFSFCVFSANATVPEDWPMSHPNWWWERTVVDYTVAPDNDSPINQGQLLYMAEQGIAELEQELMIVGGAGFTLDELRDLETQDYYAPANLGQLKNVSSKFYERFAALGFTPVAPDPDNAGQFLPFTLTAAHVDGSNPGVPVYPWGDNVTADNFSPSNIGQTKYLFAWDLSADADVDSIPDWWEAYYDIDPLKDTNNSTTDTDGDSVLDGDEYTNQTDPSDYYNGSLPTLEIISGDNQSINLGASTVDSVVLSITNSSAISLVNAPIRVSVTPSHAGTAQTTSVSAGTLIDLNTDSGGEVSVTFNSGNTYVGTASLVFSALYGFNGSSEVTRTATIFVEQLIADYNLFAGSAQSFVIHNSSGVIFGVGQNTSGQIAGVSGETVNTFSELSGLGTDIDKIVSCGEHSIALTDAGTVYAWGDNFSGQLGLGDFTSKTVPTPIPDLSNVVDIAVGDGFSCFLVKDGSDDSSIHLVGNLSGGLSAGSSLISTLTTTPIVITAFSSSDIVEIKAEGRRILARCEDGSVWAWGDNRFGQADPTQSALYLSAPECVIEATSVIDSSVIHIYASPDVSLALLSDGTLQGWGNSTFGQLGSIDTSISSSGPIEVASGVSHAAVGNGFLVYVTNTGQQQLYAAGLNDYGQLGQGSTSAVASVTPLQVTLVNTVSELVAGDRHVVYVSPENILFGFGDNRLGALGASSTDALLTPTSILNL